MRNRCVVCGFPVELDSDRFCSGCGARLRELKLCPDSVALFLGEGPHEAEFAIENAGVGPVEVKAVRFDTAGRPDRVQWTLKDAAGREDLGGGPVVRGQSARLFVDFGAVEEEARGSLLLELSDGSSEEVPVVVLPTPTMRVESTDATGLDETEDGFRLRFSPPPREGSEELPIVAIPLRICIDTGAEADIVIERVEWRPSAPNLVMEGLPSGQLELTGSGTGFDLTARVPVLGGSQQGTGIFGELRLHVAGFGVLSTELEFVPRRIGRLKTNLLNGEIIREELCPVRDVDQEIILRFTLRNTGSADLTMKAIQTNLRGFAVLLPPPPAPPLGKPLKPERTYQFELKFRVDDLDYSPAHVQVHQGMGGARLIGQRWGFEVIYESEGETLTQQFEGGFPVREPRPLRPELGEFLIMDFGTSHSCFGYTTEHEVKLVDIDPDDKLEYEHPTFMRFMDFDKLNGHSNEALLFGLTQKDQRIASKDRLLSGAFAFKPLLGKKHATGYQDDKRNFRTLTPEELTRLYLAEAITRFKRLTGRIPREAAFTYPANFSEGQVKALQDAIESSMDVLPHDLQWEEPVSLAYALLSGRTFQPEETELFAVYDFGGGTTDITIVRVQGTQRPASPVFNILSYLGADVGGEGLTHEVGRRVFTLIKQAIRKAGKLSPEQTELLDGYRYPKTVDDLERLAPDETELYRVCFYVAEHYKLNYEEIYRESEGGEKMPRVLDLQDMGYKDAPEITLSKTDFDTAASRYITHALDMFYDEVDRLLRAGAFERLDYIQLCGNASRLPLVSRLFEERFEGVPLRFNKAKAKIGVVEGLGQYVRQKTSGGGPEVQRISRSGGDGGPGAERLSFKHEGVFRKVDPETWYPWRIASYSCFLRVFQYEESVAAVADAPKYVFSLRDVLKSNGGGEVMLRFVPEERGMGLVVADATEPLPGAPRRVIAEVAPE